MAVNVTYDEQRSAAEKIADAAIKERVLLGIEFLKEEYGDDWVSYIDPEDFKIRSGAYCVLGQIEAAVHPDWEKYGVSDPFTAAIQRFDIDDVAHGFDGTTHIGREWLDDEVTEKDYDALQEAWLIVFGRDDLISARESEVE